MALSVAVQMDPIEGIDIKGDSTFALMLEAQSRGHRLRYYQPRSLALEGAHVRASAHAIEVRDEPGRHFSLSAAERIDLADMDVVLMRQDPPFDMNYITLTH